MFLLVILFFPCLLAPPALPTGYRYGQQGCQLLSNRRVERCHVCVLQAANLYACAWLEFLLPPATTTVATTTMAPIQRACTNMSPVNDQICDRNEDGSLNYCMSWEVSTSSVVYSDPPCLVNGQLPSNCRTVSPLAVICSRFDSSQHR